MSGRKLHASIAALCAAGVALSGPTECSAQLCNLFNRPAPQAAVTTYRPLFAPAPVVSQTVNYLPVTGYRTFYAPSAVTTYQPASACSACGGATTVMRPVVTYAMRPQLFPYTTYQPVVAAPLMAPACSACSAGYAPAVVTTSAPVVATSYAAPSTALPVAPIYPAAPSPGCACGAGAAPMAAPAYGAAPYGSATSNPAAYSSADVAPRLPPDQPIPNQSLAPMPQAAPGSTPTFASPSSSMYGPAVPAPPAPSYPPGTVIMGPASPGPIVTGPAVIVPPAGAAVFGQPQPLAPAGNPASRLTPNPDASPRKTFKDEAPDQPRIRLAPKRIPYPSDGGAESNGNNNNNGSGNNGESNPGAGDAPADAGGATSPKETNFQKQPQAIDPEDRMALRGVRQTTIYRAVSSPPVNSADDGVWHAAYRRP